MEVLDAAALSGLLQGHPTILVIDCRPYSEYILGHVDGALSVQLSSLLLRRLSIGRISIAQLLHDDHRELLADRLGHGCVTVVYDDGSAALDGAVDLKVPLHAVYNSLTSTTGCCYALSGGFSAFSDVYPAMVSDSKDVLSPHTIGVCSDGDPSLVSQPHVHDVQPTQILPNLYVGAQNHAGDRKLLDSLGINYILNVSTNCPNYFPDRYTYKHIKIKDTWDQKMTSFFDEAFEFIDEALRNNATIMVHCKAGISRSPTVTIAYLMRTLRIQLSQAFNAVRDKRPSICPNLDFMTELYQYERVLNLPPSRDCGFGDSPHPHGAVAEILAMAVDDEAHEQYGAQLAAMYADDDNEQPLTPRPAEPKQFTPALAAPAAAVPTPAIVMTAGAVRGTRAGSTSNSSSKSARTSSSGSSHAAEAVAAAVAFSFSPGAFSSIPSSPASPRSEIGVFAL